MKLTPEQIKALLRARDLAIEARLLVVNARLPAADGDFHEIQRGLNTAARLLVERFPEELRK